MSKDRSLQSCWTNFCSRKLKKRILATFGFNRTTHTAEATLDALRLVFEDPIISCRADVIWPPRSCNLTSLGYYLWGAVKTLVLHRQARENFLRIFQKNVIWRTVYMIVRNMIVLNHLEGYQITSINAWGLLILINIFSFALKEVLICNFTTRVLSLNCR